MYSDLDHTNALDLLRLQEKYDLSGGVASKDNKVLQLRRFFFTAVESVARGNLGEKLAAASPPSNRYPCADEAHVKTFLHKMLVKYPQ